METTDNQKLLKIIEEKNNEILQLRAKLGENEKPMSKSKSELFSVENTTKFMIKPSPIYKKIDNTTSYQTRTKECPINNFYFSTLCDYLTLFQ